jgi:hypothetical protein
MITYLIRQDSVNQYTVTKWEMGKVPTQIYRVDLSKSSRLRCNCPSGYTRKYCKHPEMVKSWIERGMPMEEIV